MDVIPGFAGETLAAWMQDKLDLCAFWFAARIRRRDPTCRPANLDSVDRPSYEITLPLDSVNVDILARVKRQIFEQRVANRSVFDASCRRVVAAASSKTQESEINGRQ